MLRSVIDKLGRQAIVGGIAPLARNQNSEDPVIGFDTEYDSKTRKFLCYQLAGQTIEGLYRSRLSVEALGSRISRAYPGAESAWLVTFWSLAELQFLPVLSSSFNWQLYGSGSFDCSFQTKAGFELRIFDLSRFFERSSLAKVAESFGLKKLEWDRTTVTKKDLSNPRFREYAIHDARLCYQIAEALRAEFLRLGADPLLSKTAAGSTATVFRRNYVREQIRTKIPRARIAGMSACWGGRAEAFRRGTFPKVYEYDLSSAYPNAVIAIREFPKEADLKEAKTIAGLLKGTGFAKVIFSHPKETEYPALPVVTKEAQIYPLEGVSWATTFEIERAITLGADIELLEGWSYRSGSTELYDMMLWALSLRKRSTGAKSIAAKLMANSLIGKLAQRRGGTDIEKLRKWAKDEAISLHDAIFLSSDELEALGLVRPNKVGTCFMPEWNALITGYTRARLHSILCSSSPVYCATDSVWSLTKLSTTPGLELKREGKGAVVRTRFGAIFEAGKDPHLAHHSIWSKDAALELIQNLGKPRHKKYTLRRPVKLKESLRTRVRIATFLEEMRMGNTEWDGKRRLLSDGSTEPWKTVDNFITYRKTNYAP